MVKLDFFRNVSKYYHFFWVLAGGCCHHSIWSRLPNRAASIKCFFCSAPLTICRTTPERWPTTTPWRKCLVKTTLAVYLMISLSFGQSWHRRVADSNTLLRLRCRSLLRNFKNKKWYSGLLKIFQRERQTLETLAHSLRAQRTSELSEPKICGNFLLKKWTPKIRSFCDAIF